MNISIVIPCNHHMDNLNNLINHIVANTKLPSEIIVIRSKLSDSVNFDEITNEFNIFNNILINLESKGIVFKILEEKHAYPGKARNIGLKHANGELIAFLDIKTIPNQDWLENSYKFLQNDNIQGVWGSVVYYSNSYFSSLVLDVIYGRNPLRSIPGTVFKKKYITVIGEMVSWVPAGEDGDWMSRVDIHKLNFLKPVKSNVIYEGLIGKNFSYFLKKWWKYYHLSRMFPINNRDRWLSYILGYIILLFCAFNWNYKISEFIFGENIIVPHITKTVLLSAMVMYFIFRSIYLPLNRGVPLINIFPLRFVFLGIFASILDFVKIVALLTPTKFFIKPKNIYSSKH